MEATVEAEPKFQILYELPDGTTVVIAIGGRGGMKSYEVSKYVCCSSTIKKKRSVILRDEKEQIRESILKEILDRYDTANESGILDYYYKKLDTGIKDKSSGQMMVYTKGFRASSKAKTSNMKGESGIDIAVVEEAEDIRDPTKYNTFADSLRKKGRLIIIMLNTPDIQHWIVKRYFNLIAITKEDVPELLHVTDADLSGYWKLVPKDIPGFVCIQTTYEDNPYLPQETIDSYRGYGDPKHHLYDLHHYLTAIKGFASSGRKGQVFRKIKPCKLADYLKLPYPEMYAQDFGTSSPAGLIGFKVHKNTFWARELNYLPMEVLPIGILYCKLGFTGNDRIIYDYADKTAGDKLKYGFKPTELTQEQLEKYPGLVRGFNMIKCEKDIQFGISLINGMEGYVCEESTNFWAEILNHIYQQNKSGEYTNDPEDSWNHLLDALKYGIADQRGKKHLYGI